MWESEIEQVLKSVAGECLNVVIQSNNSRGGMTDISFLGLDDFLVM